jgi:hypothetical protein
MSHSDRNERRDLDRINVAEMVTITKYPNAYIIWNQIGFNVSEDSCTILSPCRTFQRCATTNPIFLIYATDAMS